MLQNVTDLWLLDSTRQMRFTSGSAGNITLFPIWSPDGSRIAFEHVGSGSIKVSMKPSTGGDEEVLLESPLVKVPTDWSPDGRFLLYYVPDPKTGTDLWVLPLDGQRVPFIFLKTEASELLGQFSPDGHWVAYQSNESGRHEIYVRPFPGPGEQFPISTAGGVYPRWSADGKELYYIAPDAKLMAVTISAKGSAFEAGTPTALFQTRRVGGGSNVVGRGPQYDVTPDGRFLINTEAGSGAAPITLLLNWKPSESGR
jgi:Tol biopolymer transport system component